MVKKNCYFRDAQLVARSAAMRQVVDQVRRIAPTGRPVLIEGETGVGKATLARLVHRQSLQAKGPFIHIFCGSIGRCGPTLDFEQATEDASQRIAAFFKAADPGTLFLDDVDEMPAVFQDELIRTLTRDRWNHSWQSGLRRVNVRILAATTRDLATAVKNGRFLAELDKFLTKSRIYIPPLRERREDIRPIAESLLRRFHRVFELGIPHDYGLTEESWERLVQHSWPGNVQELSNVVKQTLLFSTDRKDHLLEVGLLEEPEHLAKSFSPFALHALDNAR